MPKKGYKQSDKQKSNISISLKGKKPTKGMTGKKQSEETKQKIANTLKGHIGWFKNKKRSEEDKLKISLGSKGKNKGKIGYWKGKIFTEEHKKNLSVNSKGKNLGRKCSVETKQKLSLINKGKKLLEETKQKIREKRKYQKNTWTSSIEKKLQNYLKQLNIDYIPHKYIPNISLPYQCDIFVPSYNLVIEADGEYTHNYPIGNKKDDIRTKELLEKGFNVLRLWEKDINKLTLEEFKNKLQLIEVI